LPVDSELLGARLERLLMPPSNSCSIHSYFSSLGIPHHPSRLQTILACRCRRRTGNDTALPHTHPLCTTSLTVPSLNAQHGIGRRSKESGWGMGFHFAAEVRDVTIKGLVESPSALIADALQPWPENPRTQKQTQDSQNQIPENHH
jgi:hypothetical protein